MCIRDSTGAKDIIEIIKYLIQLINSSATVDDIDHLSNRRVRTVGEQLANQFSIGLALSLIHIYHYQLCSHRV